MSDPTSQVSPSSRTNWQKGITEKTKKQSEKITEEIVLKTFLEKKTETPPLSSEKIHPGLKTKSGIKTAKVASKSSYIDKSKEFVQLGQTVLQHKAAILYAIILRLRMSPRIVIPGTLQTGFFAVGASLGGLISVISLPEIVRGISSTISEIRNLHRKNKATSKNVFKVIFRKSTVDTPLLRDSIALAHGVLIMTYHIGSLARTLGPEILAALGVALQTVGGAVGGLTILFGGFQIGLGIKGVIEAKKELFKAEAQLHEFDAQKEPLSFEQQLKKLHHLGAVKMAHRKKTQSIIKACMGAFITVGGAVSIGAIFTGGWTALGLAIAAIVLGVTATGVAISDQIYQKKTEAEIWREFNKVLENSKITITNPDQWKNLALKLGLNSNISEEEREKELRHYCLGKEGKITIGRQRLSSNIPQQA